MLRFGPALTLFAGTVLIVGSLVPLTVSDEPRAWLLAPPALAAVVPAVSAALLIRRRRHAKGLHRQGRELEARAAYLAALAQRCAADPTTAGAQARREAAEALRVMRDFDDVSARLASFPRTAPILVSVAGGLGAASLGLTAYLMWALPDETYSDEHHLGPERRRVVFNLVAGAGVGVAMLTGGGDLGGAERARAAGARAFVLAPARAA